MAKKDSVGEDENRKPWYIRYLWLMLSSVVVIALIVGMVAITTAKNNRENQARVQEELEAQATPTATTAVAGIDSQLFQQQERLETRYGIAPEGFIWGYAGDLIALGDPAISPEDTIYTFLRSASTLDISTASRYSRSSSVVTTYNDYFNPMTGQYADYKDNFTHSMYRACLLSMGVTELSDATVFADNKQTYTVTANLLDLTDKTFWEKDRDTIFQNMYTYDHDQGDSTKAMNYLYEYVGNYYSSESPTMSTTSFDVTIQKYADVGSGWLVAIDTGLDSACKNRDGEQTVSFIKSQFDAYKVQKSTGQI